MEIKIGVQHSPRELTVDSPLSTEEIESLVAAAVSGSSDVLSLADERGRKVIVPTAKIAYIELGEPEVRRVGFGAL